MLTKIISNDPIAYIEISNIPLFNHRKPALIRYFMALRELINPEHQPIHGYHGCSGPNITNYLLATNAVHSTFIDLNPFDAEKFKYCCINQSQIMPHLEEMQNEFDEYNGFWWSRDLKIKNIEAKAFFELLSLGAHSISHEALGKKSTRISFNWTYPGFKEQRYSIQFIEANIVHTHEWLQENYRLFFQSAAVGAVAIYNQYIPAISHQLPKGGMFVTNDIVFNPFQEEHQWKLMDEILLNHGISYEHIDPVKVSENLRNMRSSLTGLRRFKQYGLDMMIRKII